MKSEDSFNVAMIDTMTNKAYQIATNITQTEAYNMVFDLRSKRDGNRYWIGKVEWLKVNFYEYEGGLKDG